MSTHHFPPLLPPAPTPLEELRAEQHDDLRLSSDAALEAFLCEIPAHVALRDLLPTTEIERRHLERLKGAA